MRRALLLTTLLLLGFPAAADAASVKLLECVPALEPHDRAATFEARVAAARGSERLQVRFTLQVREGAPARWRRVVAPGLDEWLTSDRGVSRYSYAKTVLNLAAPAAYRMVARFRWLDVDGAVLARSRAASRICHQPDMRPDLGVVQIDFAPLDSGATRYAVTLRNSGRTEAGPSTAGLRVGDEQLAPLSVAGLLPGERRVVVFMGPACPDGGLIHATVDTGGAVDERDEDDNAVVATCRA